MSQFINHTDDYSSEFTTGIDFDDAVKLPGGGSTCDIFKTRWQRRDVFVKRLKEGLRSKPLYLDALDKEVSAKWNAIAVKAYGTNGNGFDFGDLFKGGFNPNAGGAPNSAKPNDETPNGSKDDFEEV